MDLTTFRSLKEGDKVKVSKVVTVKTNGGIYSITDENGHSYSNRETVSFPSLMGGYGRYEFDMELVERAKPKEPVHWPPQPGDVWRQENKVEVYVSGDAISFPLRTELYFVAHNDSPSTKEKLLKNNPVLVYRKGNN